MHVWPWLRTLLVVLVLLALVSAFGYWVWPTPWTYYEVGPRQFRRHRVWGQVQEHWNGRWDEDHARLL